MKSRRIVSIGFIGSIILAGCSQSPPMVIQPQPENTGDRTSVAAASASSAPKISEPTFNAPQALERKTAAYTQQMQAMIGTTPKDDLTKDEVATPTTSPVAPDMDSAPTVRATWDDSADLKQKNPLPQDAMKPEPRHPAPNPSLVPAPTPAQPVADRREPVNHSTNPSGAKAVDPNTPGTNQAGANQTGANQTGANTPATVEPREPIAAAATISPSNTSANTSELQQKLDKRVKDYPRDLSAQLDFQLMKFLLEDRVPDLSVLTALPTEDREVISSLVDGLSNFRTAIRADNNMLLSKKVRPLLEMADRLRGHADLSIPTIALCTRVIAYGEYDPVEPTQFSAGKDHPMILYCEVENFSSQLNEQQRWQTKLTEEAVLFTESGMPVWNDKSQPIDDVARHRRHDFFIVKRMTIPSSLAVGRYLLKVTVVDQQMSRVAEATLPIVIAVQ